MRTSSKQTTVAVLRGILGLSVEALGNLIGKSVSTIKSLESGSGRLKLGEETAWTIAKETGVSADWLLAGDTSVEPFAQTPQGRVPYERATYVVTQALKTAEYVLPKDEPARIHVEAVQACLDWFPILAAAHKRGEAASAQELIGDFIFQMSQRFGRNDKMAAKISRKAKLVAADGREYLFAYEKGRAELIPLQEEPGFKIFGAKRGSSQKAPVLQVAAVRKTPKSSPSRPSSASVHPGDGRKSA